MAMYKVQRFFQWYFTKWSQSCTSDLDNVTVVFCTVRVTVLSVSVSLCTWAQSQQYYTLYNNGFSYLTSNNGDLLIQILFVYLKITSATLYKLELTKRAFYKTFFNFYKYNNE